MFNISKGSLFVNKALEQRRYYFFHIMRKNNIGDYLTRNYR